MQKLLLALLAVSFIAQAQIAQSRNAQAQSALAWEKFLDVEDPDFFADKVKPDEVWPLPGGEHPPLSTVAQMQAAERELLVHPRIDGLVWMHYSALFIYGDIDPRAAETFASTLCRVMEKHDALRPPHTDGPILMTVIDKQLWLDYGHEERQAEVFCK